MIIGRAVNQVRNAVLTGTEWVGMPTLILSNRVAIRYSFSMKGSDLLRQTRGRQTRGRQTGGKCGEDEDENICQVCRGNYDDDGDEAQEGWIGFDEMGCWR